jgi:hypothetical protein
MPRLCKRLVDNKMYLNWYKEHDIQRLVGDIKLDYYLYDYRKA